MLHKHNNMWKCKLTNLFNDTHVKNKGNLNYVSQKKKGIIIIIIIIINEPIYLD